MLRTCSRFGVGGHRVYVTGHVDMYDDLRPVFDGVIIGDETDTSDFEIEFGWCVILRFSFTASLWAR